jgi:hypothetical protein
MPKDRQAEKSEPELRAFELDFSRRICYTTSMSKINDKKTLIKILSGLKIIAILALGLAATPVLARDTAYVSGYRNPPPVEEERVREVATAPVITGISPDEVTAGAGAKTITVTGSGFMPSSVVKINGSNRYTTFIDDSHLLAQATAYDFYRTDGGFYVTVWNSNGDYSNAEYVAVKGTLPAANNNNNNSNRNPSNYGTNDNNGYNPAPINYYPGTLDNNADDQSLASSVILGGNSFLPTGLVQWVLVAILIVGIIVLGRKVFKTREHYDSTPLKHA